MQTGFIAAKIGNPQDYTAAFLIHCHHLIEIGYKLMAQKDYRLSEEEVITGRLTQAIEKFLNSENAPLWTEHFAIYEEKRINSEDREGHHRFRIDIVIKHVAGKRPEHIFEAKRLNGSDSLSKYTGKDGMGRFLDGRYGASQNHATMLGYVQTESVYHWIGKLKEHILKHQTKLSVQDAWEKTNLISDHCDMKETGVTTHKRTKNLPPIHIYHQFLEFQNKHIQQDFQEQ